MMKFRTVFFSIFLSLAVVLTGCSSPGQGEKQGLSVITSFYPIYVFTLNVTDGVEGVTVSNLTEPQTGCLHDYALLAKDVKNIEKSDVFIINGGGMEGFLNDVSSLADTQILDTSKGIEIVDGNPHIWLSLENAAVQVHNIADGLSEKDAANAAKYQANAKAYIDRLMALNETYKTELAGAKGEKIVTFHEAFTYFAQAYGFEVAAVMAYEPDSTPTAKEMIDVINIVKNEKIKALFAEPQYSDKIAQSISQETGVPIYTLDPATTGEMKKEAFIEIMTKNLETLKQVYVTQQ